MKNYGTLPRSSDLPAGRELANPLVFGKDGVEVVKKVFQIKICGITSVEDAAAVVRAGADAIGLNFYRGSPRCVTAETARQIVQMLPSRITKVGLFVNSLAGEAIRIFDTLQLDILQLHGDEPPEYLAELAPRPIMRAFRLGPEGIDPVLTYLEQCRSHQCEPDFVLFDALKSGIYGGTGEKTDWTAAQAYLSQKERPPLVLAGGLTPQNVAAAIQSVRPPAVDVSSGVEASPGRKDWDAVTAFVAAARAAFDTVPPPLAEPESSS